MERRVAGLSSYRRPSSPSYWPHQVPCQVDRWMGCDRRPIPELRHCDMSKNALHYRHFIYAWFTGIPAARRSDRCCSLPSTARSAPASRTATRFATCHRSALCGPRIRDLNRPNDSHVRSMRRKGRYDTSSYFGQVVGQRYCYCSFFAAAAAISVSKHGAESCETCAFMQALIRP
jgi:hypothetical protein